MKFFLSAELDGTRKDDQIDKKWQKASTYICSRLEPFLLNKSYGSEVELLGVIPMVVKPTREMIEAGWYKERKLFKRKTKSSDFRLHIDYDLFRDGNDEDRIKLILQNIIESLIILDSRAKKDFNGKQLESDIRNLFNYQNN